MRFCLGVSGHRLETAQTRPVAIASRRPMRHTADTDVRVFSLRSIRRKLALSLAYLERRTLRSDLEVLIRTATRVVGWRRDDRDLELTGFPRNLTSGGEG